MAAIKTKNKQQRAERVERAWNLRLRGWTLRQIAENVGVTLQQIDYDLRVARNEQIKRMHVSAESLIAEKVAAYENIRMTAWAAYDASVSNLERETEEYALQTDEQTMMASEVRIKRIVMREGRLPANVYLSTIMQTLQAERELLGLDQPTKTEVSGAVAVAVFDWSALSHRVDEPDAIEARIKGLIDVPKTFEVDVIETVHEVPSNVRAGVEGTAGVPVVPTVE